MTNDLKKKKNEYMRAYYQLHKEVMLERVRSYRKNNPEKIKATEQKKREKEGYLEKKRVYDKEYGKKNRAKLTIYQREHKKNSLQRQISMKLRARIRRALKQNYKCSSSEELLGCTIKELQSHLEKNFKDGMTWDVYSQALWHIDHIKPCASFDLSDPEQQKQCFHYTNLQPLWAKENLVKGSKV